MLWRLNFRRSVMNKIKLLSAALLCFAAQQASAFTDKEMQVIKSFEVDAYQLMASNYSDYAGYFNLCQKQPNHEKCKNEYKGAQQAYRISKANYDVLAMLKKDNMLTLALPDNAQQELFEGLQTLGYVDEKKDFNHTELLAAVNQWGQKHQLNRSDELYLLHLIMINTQLLGEEND